MKMCRWSFILLGSLLAGIAPLHASLIITFNEFGAASYSTNGGVTFVALPAGATELDPTGGVSGNVLVYNFQPAFTAAGASATFFGDVPIAGFAGGLSDDLRFTDAQGDKSGTSAPLMIFYSFDNLGAPADVGNISTSFLYTQTPMATEGANGFFTYDSGGGLPGGVLYEGESDVPEPASVSMLLLGLGALGFRIFRCKSTMT